MPRSLTVGSVTRMKHMPGGAFSSVPMTILSSARTGPSSRAPAPRTGQAGNRKRQRRCGGAGTACRQYVRHAGRIRNPLFAADGSITGRSRDAIAPRSCDHLIPRPPANPAS